MRNLVVDVSQKRQARPATRFHDCNKVAAVELERHGTPRTQQMGDHVGRTNVLLMEAKGPNTRTLLAVTCPDASNEMGADISPSERHKTACTRLASAQTGQMTLTGRA